MISFMRLFAMAAHGNQQYDGQPYVTHLDAVVEILREYGHSVLIPQGYLHDVLEDTSLGELELYAGAGLDPEQIADIRAVTGEGTNRKERNASVYRKLRARPRAIPLKQADRLANTRHSLQSGNAAKFNMYRKEYPEFRRQLYPLGDGAMWAELDRLMEFASSAD